MITSASVAALDEIRQSCLEHATPDFRNWLRHRSRRHPVRLPSTKSAMRMVGHAIAYSQGARSIAVGDLLASGTLDQAFSKFDPEKLARRSAPTLIRHHWGALGAIRFKGKVDSILRAAKVLNRIAREHRSFSSYLRRFGIPRRIRNQCDIDVFWHTFDDFQKDMKARGMPFFNKTTSLLQLLLDLDYDSIKPDLIVMRLSRRIGLVEKETGDRYLREAVWSLQVYGVLRGVRPAAMDWYLLTFGGQTGAAQTLNRRFCPGPNLCRLDDCRVGCRGLCSDHRR